ncbi:MAG: hypothetical protein AB7P40_00160 [Chloroflexota bacterium]
MTAAEMLSAVFAPKPLAGHIAERSRATSDAETVLLRHESGAWRQTAEAERREIARRLLFTRWRCRGEIAQTRQMAAWRQLADENRRLGFVDLAELCDVQAAVVAAGGPIDWGWL